MRLLLDEMHAPSVAEALRSAGHDVLAVAERPDLRGQPDDEVLAVAAAAGRAVVTENVRDFVPLAAQWAAASREHAGLLLTSPQRFDRARLAYPGDLQAALSAFLEDPPIEGSSWTWWL